MQDRILCYARRGGDCAFFIDLTHNDPVSRIIQVLVQGHDVCTIHRHFSVVGES